MTTQQHPINALHSPPFSNATSSISLPSTQGLSNQPKKPPASSPTLSPSRISTLKTLAPASRTRTSLHETTSPPSSLPSPSSASLPSSKRLFLLASTFSPRSPSPRTSPQHEASLPTLSASAPRPRPPLRSPRTSGFTPASPMPPPRPQSSVESTTSPSASCGASSPTTSGTTPLGARRPTIREASYSTAVFTGRRPRGCC